MKADHAFHLNQTQLMVVSDEKIVVEQSEHKVVETRNFQSDQQLQLPQTEHLKGGKDHASGLYKHSKPANTNNVTRKQVKPII